MPAAPVDSLVLLTGGSGFLAAHIGQQLLQRGFTVRATVRSNEKGDYLKELYAKDGLTRFDYVIVEDFLQDGAFDKAVIGVDGVLHTASPFHYRNIEDPIKNLIEPAVKGTEGLLKSALLEPKIQRVVITSSFASIFNPIDPPYTFTEDDWNTFSPGEVERDGKNVNHSQAYRASKTLAERSAWKFIEDNTKDGVAPFDLATICPPLIFGNPIQQVKDVGSLNTSNASFYAFLTGDKTDEDALAAFGSFVDVRDVARLHIDALVTPEASNKRFAASGGAYYPQLFLDVLHSPKYDYLLKEFPKAIRGKPGSPEPIQTKLDASRAEKTFDWTPIPLEKTVVDLVEGLAEKQKEW